MNSTVGLINKLKAAEITIEELSPEEIEEIVFYTTEQNLKNTINSSVERYKKGPIDVIIKAKYSTPGFIPGQQKEHVHVVYIECKHYKRKVEFDRAAKVFLVAIKDGPNELVIVSTSGIAPQAWKYVSHFFSSEMGDGFFKQIKFRLVSMEDILGLHQHKQIIQKQLAGDQPDFYIKGYRIVASDGFSRKTIFDSSGDVKDISFANYFQYLLEIQLDRDLPHNAHVTLKFDHGKHQRKKLVRTRNSILGTVSILLEKDMVCNLMSHGKIEIVIKGDDEITLLAKSVLELPALHFDPLMRLELNDGYRENLIENAVKENGPVILFIGGEGGIGKSFFCETICARLAFERGFRIHKITAKEEFTPVMLLKMLLWPLLLPDVSADNIKDDSGLQNIVKESLRMLVGNEFETRILLKLLSFEEIKNDEVHFIAHLLGKIIAVNPVPQAILIKDCHKFSPELIRILNILIGKLADEDWGSVRLLFEFRNSPLNTHREWDLFVTAVTSGYSAKVSSAILPDFSEADIGRGLQRCVAGEQSQSLAKIIYQKAGGNPLFIRTLLYSAISSSHLNISPVHPSRLIVTDQLGLADEMQKLPDGITHLLSVRISDVLSQHVFEQSSFIHYLTALIYLRQIPDFEARLSELSLDETDSYNHYLVSSGIARPTLEGSHVEFNHEMLGVAVCTEINKSLFFIPAVRSVEKRLDPGNISHTLAAGKMFFDANQLSKSYRWYNFCYSLSEKENRFQFKRLALRGCKKILDQDMTSESMPKRMAISLELAWNEVQSGSQIQALITVDEVINTLAAYQKRSLSGEEALWLQDAYKQKMLTCSRLMKPLAFYHTFEQSFFNKKNNEQFRSGLTRLLLQCCNTDFPFEAYKIAEILAARMSEITGDNYSSLCSDFGRIFLQSDPRTALKWWAKGLKPAVSPRQQSHSKINKMIGELYVKQKFPPLTLIKSVKNKVKNMGVENQLIRIILLEGILAASSNDFEMAGYYFNQALQISQNVNQVFWEWKCHNNLAVLALIDKNTEVAESHIEKGYAILEETVRFSETGRDRVLKTVNDVCSAFPLAQNKVIPDTLDQSAHSGLFYVLLWNAQFINGYFKKVDRLPIDISLSHPLVVQSNKINLFFAIE